MSYKITIPKPCHQDWNSFTQVEQGKHCQVCAKTVLDFTTWEPNAISNYLLTNKEEETCGRFTEKQLENKLPTAEVFAKQISYFRMSTLKKIAAIFLFAFVLQSNSYAAEATIHGGTALIPSSFNDSIFTASAYKKLYFKKLAVKKDKPKKKKTKTKTKSKKGKVKIVKTNIPEPFIMGKMVVMPNN
jgi:hypothetical protein